MTRAILVAGAVTWSAAGVAALLVALIGVERLVALLPPLQIDSEAVRGAVTVVSAGLAVGAIAHVAVIAGLRRRHRRAWSAGILLCALLAATFVALASAAFTSTVAQPEMAVPLLGAGGAAALAALAYAVATASLVSELRAGTPG